MARVIGRIQKVRGTECMVVPVEEWEQWVKTVPAEGDGVEVTALSGCQDECDTVCAESGGCLKCWIGGGICGSGAPYVT